MVEAVKRNFPQSEIADASWRYQTEVDEGKRLVVGVNSYENDERADRDPQHRRRPSSPSRSSACVRARAQRDSTAVESSLARLKLAAADPAHNLMPPLIECARAYCTEGEMVQALQEVFGTYSESPVF